MPIVVVTYVVPATFFLHATSFLFGFAVFGQPLIDRCVCWLTHHVPDWREYFDLKTIASSVIVVTLGHLLYRMSSANTQRFQTEECPP